MKTYSVEENHAMEPVDMTPDGAVLPRAGTLEGFALETADGIDIRSLASGTTLHVDTRNTHYRLVVLNPTRLSVLIEGGALIRNETEARLNGATCGGSALKSGWIGVGSRMDVWVEGRRIVTSPVRSINVESVH
jgi:hypothetical protein